MSTTDLENELKHWQEQSDGWMKREEDAISVARVLFFVLNQIPNTRINYVPEIPSTYALLSYLENHPVYSSVVRQSHPVNGGTVRAIDLGVSGD